jgi:hypothetical protein
MVRRLLHCLGLAVGALLGVDGYAADTLRCETGRLIDVGMLAAEVTARCGEPRSRSVEEIPVRARTRTGNVVQTGTTRAERWVYRRGQGQFDAQLTFEDGKLVRIDLLTQP